LKVEKMAKLIRDITNAEIEAFNNDGIVCLRGLFSNEWVEKLREAADMSMNKPSDMAIELAEELGAKGRFFHETFVWLHNEICKDFIYNSPGAEMAQKVMKSEKINIFFDQWLIKEPGTGAPTPWHQDMPYWPIKGRQIATLWVALDPVTAESGAVEYIKGSHKWPQDYKPATFSGNHDYGDDLPEVPDIEATRDQYDIVQFELEPGDCTIHQGSIMHAAPGNASSTTRRRAYVSRWAGDDVVYDLRDGIQEMPPLPDIPNGGPIDSALWPKIIG
jgi:ectoine hydroxylase-related dioxygenase (phytanoyl-CoA dioxygenase family)